MTEVSSNRHPPRMSATIAFQPVLRPALPTVYGPLDYRTQRALFERIDAILSASGLEGALPHRRLSRSNHRPQQAQRQAAAAIRAFQHRLLAGQYRTHAARPRPPQVLCSCCPGHRRAHILLFLQHGNPSRLPDVEAVEFLQWHKFLETAHEYRCNPSSEEPAVLMMDRPTKRVTEEFYAQFAEALLRAPESTHPYLRWLPDLPLRLYSILVMFKSLDQTLQGITSTEPPASPEPDPDRHRKLMWQAVRLTRWLCQEHYRVVRGYTEGWSTDRTEQATDNTDMTALEEHIWRV
jgi:hypothetical protein